MLKPTLHLVSVVLLSVVVLGLSGCPFKKKKPPVPPPAAQAPITTAPAPEQPQPQPPAEPPKEEQKPEPAAVKPKPKPKPKQTQTAHKAAPAAATKPEEKPQQQASAKPPRIVIQEGGTPSNSGQISTPMGHDEAAHRRLSTAQLIESTETTLRGLNRTLTADEQATVAQIKDYLEQSRAATVQQDVVRAHNLALKAHLLSDELVKQ